MRCGRVRCIRSQWSSRPPYERANMPSARVAARAHAGNGGSLPRTPREIQQYCRKALRAELQRDTFDIMRACLLVALEEEAALSVHQSMIFENLRAQGQDVSEAMASINSKIESAVGSQFNTARVDLLADMVLQRFIQALDLPLPNDLPIQGPAEDDEPPSTGASPGTSEASRSSITKRPKAEPPSPPSVQSSSAVASNPLTSTPPNLSGSEPSNEGESGREQDPIGNANSPESITSSDADSAAPPRQPGASTDAKSSSDSNESESPPPTAPTSDAASAAPAQKSGASNADKLPRLPSLAALQRPQRVPHLAEHPALPPLLRSHSALFLHVASDVLFNMHGYRQPLTHKGAQRVNMDAFLMNIVLETGVGAPIVLAIVFRAVCQRAGVSVNLSVLDGGSDCVVWPEGATGESGIRVSGHTLVLDIFSRGAVMLEAEVKEFFDVESLTPATDRDLLFAVLSGLQDCNWRLALDHADVWSRSSVAQCLQAALQPITAVKEPYHLSRAVAAAERCLLVKPRHIELHLYAAALCFLDQNLHRCQQHLQLVYGPGALGASRATGSVDLSSSSGDDSDCEEGGANASVNASADSHRGKDSCAGGPPSVFAVRRNVSIEDVCLLQRPRWQGGLAHARAGSQRAFMHSVQERLAVLGVDSGLGVDSEGVGGSSNPEVRVVKRGGSRGAQGGATADSGAQGGEEVVERLREEEVVLRRPRRCGTGTGAAAKVATGATGDTGSHSGVATGATEGSPPVGGEEEDGGVWEWSEGEGELVFVSDRGEKVALVLTDQAPLPLDRSIMGEISEDVGLLWHKTMLMQRMGDTDFD